MDSQAGFSNPNGADRAGRIQHVVEDCIRRRSAGEDLSDEQVISSHLELMPELAIELHKLRLVQAARRQAANHAGPTWPGAGPLGGVLPAGLEGYELVREIHRGGQGVVYQAIQKSTGRKVAIKVLHGSPLVDARSRARLEREVQILGQLEHPNIVHVVDSGLAAGCPFLVMDYVSGEALDSFMQQHRLSVTDTLHLLVKICEAVNAAHLRGVIHRDLKPGNIRVDAAGEPHVLDFGLARVAADAVTGGEHPQLVSQSGQFIGSLPWAAPEQAEGLPGKIDMRTDVYALGVIAYQMLTGRTPYDVTGSMREVLDRILTATPPRPSTFRREIDDELDTIVLRCLAKERQRRYQSAGELARDIRHYLGGEPIDAKRDSLGYVLRKHLGRYRVALSIAAAFILLVTGGFFTTLVFWRQAARQKEIAQGHARRAELVADFLDQILTAVDPEVARADRDSLLYRALHDTLEVAAARVEALNEEPQVEAQVRRSLGRVYNSLGMYREAEQQLRQALEARRTSFPSQDAGTAELLLAWATTLGELEQFDDARRACQQAREIRSGLFGGDSLPVAEALDLLGQLLAEQQHFAEAKGYLEQALELRRRLSAPPREVARNLAVLGWTLLNLERMEEAEPLFREALTIRAQLFGLEHPDTIVSLNHLGLLLKKKGDLAAARDVYTQALELRRKVLGDRHPHLAVSHYNLASLLTAEKNDQQAVLHFQQALSIWRESQSPEHRETHSAVVNLSGCLVRLGRFREAEELLLGHYQLLVELIGPEDSRTKDIAGYLVRLYNAWGKPEEAERWRTRLPARGPPADSVQP